MAQFQTMLQSIAAIASVIIVYVCIHALYNVYFHPLRKIPGPKLWATSRAAWCWYQYRGNLHYRLLELHVKYGHAVRVAPNEVSYTSSDAWKTIYGFGQRSIEMGKDPVFRLQTPTGVQNILVADRETHTRQRRLLSHAFSERALREQEDIIQHYVHKLLDQLSARCSDGDINMVAWLSFTSFDLIGHMSFGENFGCLDQGDYVPFVAAISNMATELTFNQMWKYWNLMPIRQWFMPKHLIGKRVENIKRAMTTVARRIERGSEHKDFLHYILAAKDEKGMSREEIHVNAFSLNIAGSESTATALSGALYFLLSHPQAYRTLEDEICRSFACEADITLAASYGLQYLEAVLSESLRLYPPVAITLPRRVPAGGDIIHGDYIPEGTTVGVHHFAAYHHPLNFHAPDDFLPERWLPETKDSYPYDKDDRDSFQPFSFGSRGCLGKNLARAELRLILAKLLFRFEIELVKPRAEWTQQRCQGFWQKQPLMCTLRRRRPVELSDCVA